MLLALAMVLSYVEAMSPINIGVPGVKLGLPNIVTVIGLYSIGALPTLVILAVLFFALRPLFRKLSAKAKARREEKKSTAANKNKAE